jgi:hypothetical protein
MAKATHNLPHFYKRHYETIALAMQEALLYAECKDNQALVDGVQLAVKELASTFAGDNCHFQRNRFIAACVPGANVRSRNGGAR